MMLRTVQTALPLRIGAKTLLSQTHAQASLTDLPPIICLSSKSLFPYATGRTTWPSHSSEGLTALTCFSMRHSADDRAAEH